MSKGDFITMIEVRSVAGRLVLILAAITTFGLLLAACNDDDGGSSDSVVTQSDDADVDENAPDPEPVEPEELDIIDEWEEAGVPRFRDGEVLDFEPHASRIENGGTLLLDGVNAGSDEVIAFYRGALGSLGWVERRVGEREMTAESDVASLLVTVNEYEDQTLIMMILTDRLGES